MHCANCGTSIPPGGRFCSSCGTVVADPEMTRIAPTGSSIPALRNEPERDGEPIIVARPTMLFIKLGYAAAILGAILLTALLASFTSLGLSAFIAVAIALSLLLIPAYYHIRRSAIRYKLTESEIEIDRGLLGRTTRNIPLRAVQDVTVQASILQRLLGYGDVIIDNADEQRGSVVLENIQNPRQFRDLLLREMRRQR